MGHQHQGPDQEHQGRSPIPVSWRSRRRGVNSAPSNPNARHLMATPLFQTFEMRIRDPWVITMT